MASTLKKPVCVDCFNEAKASLAGKKATFIPGYTNWPRMINGWISDHPKTIFTPRWSCAASLDLSTVACDRHWCEPCAIKALKLLSTVSSYDCMTWDDTNASDHVVAIREKMAESADGGAQKKQKTVVVPAAKAKDTSTGKRELFSLMCSVRSGVW